MNDLILLDFKLTKFRGKFRVWYLSVKTVDDEQHWIADEDIHQEKYILYSLENWLSMHKDKEIILLQSSNYQLSLLLKRIAYYGLPSIQILSDSINWNQFCSMAILWGLPTHHSKLLQLATDPNQKDNSEFIELQNPENKKIILNGIVTKTNRQYNQVINLIDKFRSVF
jgi:hypothetical protein